ncbi:GvpL/GvpF family gas vesicle protein [Bacillus salipaludis]|uniref:GvpL/GvpF family gas vesicle protein n=1 Tax=Bacillus salipaludis TaxID=2547811 RepID=UPI002E1C7669|nr:GvpL/GvpF family gas vesicle protein [Bacillus salipaludis]
MSSRRGVYVFCAIPEKEPKKFGNVKINNQSKEVYTIHYKNAAMVVAEVKGEVLPNRNNVFAHQKTITDVMNGYCLIPFSFGNVFQSKEDVLLILKHLYDEFQNLFLELENKIEVGLKVIAKKEWIEQEMKKDSFLNEWKTANKDGSTSVSYYDQINLGEHAKNLVATLENEVEREIYDPLLELAEAGKQNNTLPGKILLNAAFLVDISKEEAFDKKVNELYEVWKEKVDFKYTGPWPAYNFVNIRLRIEGNE